MNFIQQKTDSLFESPFFGRRVRGNVRTLSIVLSNVRDRDLLVNAYGIYVRTSLEYCTVVWLPHHTRLVNRMESVQRTSQRKSKGFRLCIIQTDCMYHLKLALLNLI